MKIKAIRRSAFLLACYAAMSVATSASTLPYATWVSCDFQKPEQGILDLHFFQGATPLVAVRPLLNGSPITPDTNTTVRMIIGPTATGSLYGVRTNYTITEGAWAIQWPTIGTNSASGSWFYTLLFDREGYTYWSGSGRLYIEETTSTASNGVDWIEYTIPNVGWANVVGDPADNAALVTYISENGATGEDSVARAGVAALESNLTAHATDTDNPHAVTAAQIGALTNETDAAALEALGLVQQELDAGVRVESVGGPLYPDFATTSFGRVGGYTNGWEDATGDVVTTGAVVATVMHRSLVDRFTVAVSNVRPDGAEAVIAAGANMQDGDFHYSEYLYAPFNSSAGLVTNGPHWIPGTAAGSTGTVTVTVGDFAATLERTRPEIYGITNYLEFVSFVPGSLHADTFDAMYALASASGASTNVFTSADPWTRNPAVWTGDIDLTCVAASNSWSQNYGSGVAITPQHFAMSKHWPGVTAIGHTFTWIDNDNVAHTRTVTDVRTNTGHSDAAIGLLDSPLPASITPASLFDVAQYDKLNAPWCAVTMTNGPPDYGFAWIGPTSGLFGMKFSRNRRVSPSFMVMPDAGASAVAMGPDTTMPLFSRVQGGDSGQPSLAYVAGTTVLVTTFHSYNTGPQYAACVAEIEAAMADMGGSIYGTVSLVDLSAWPNY
jgi:hypothetical protein